jgi:hypothetical protein
MSCEGRGVLQALAAGLRQRQSSRALPFNGLLTSYPAHAPAGPSFPEPLNWIWHGWCINMRVHSIWSAPLASQETPRGQGVEGAMPLLLKPKKKGMEHNVDYARTLHLPFPAARESVRIARPG